jgi:hypoxanthine phosphoribosyltransferase
MIKTNQGKMIASLLNKPYKKIVLNRFIKQNEEETSLLTKPEEVKKGVAEHYKKQFRERNTKLEEMSEKWKEIYRPRRDIKEECMQKSNRKLMKKNGKKY